MKNKFWLILRNIKQTIFKDYSTDIALRYLPVIDVIKKNNFRDSQILEVGSGDLGITLYLKKKIVGIDIEFGNNDNSLLQKIKIDGKRFPFADNEFDVVISVDNLEHIRRGERKNFINEILRVAKKGVIMTLPCGSLAYNHDKKIAQYFYQTYRSSDRFLNEHLANGLPEISDVVEMFEKSASSLNKKIKIKLPRKLLNLRIREFIMKCKISRNFALSILYYLFLFFLPFRKLLNFGNCYRQLFFIRVY